MANSVCVCGASGRAGALCDYVCVHARALYLFSFTSQSEQDCGNTSVGPSEECFSQIFVQQWFKLSPARSRRRHTGAPATFSFTYISGPSSLFCRCPGAHSCSIHPGQGESPPPPIPFTGSLFCLTGGPWDPNTEGSLLKKELPPSGCSRRPWGVQESIAHMEEGSRVLPVSPSKVKKG